MKKKLEERQKLIDKQFEYLENNLIKNEKEEENKVLDNEIKNNENNMENNNNNNLINSRKRASVDNVYENREKIRPSTPKKKKSTKDF